MEHSFHYHTRNNYARRIMINEYNAKEFCREDISLIENYDRAIADTTQTWHCHHRRESIYTRDGLKEIGEYFHRPACELIFLTPFDHLSLHASGENNSMFGVGHTPETREKISRIMKGNKNHLGIKHSEEAKRKMSEIKLGNKYRVGKRHTEETKHKISEAKKGKVWANNGVVSKMFSPDSIPTGWSLGRISWKVSP